MFTSLSLSCTLAFKISTTIGILLVCEEVVIGDVFVGQRDRCTYPLELELSKSHICRLHSQSADNNIELVALSTKAGKWAVMPLLPQQFCFFFDRDFQAK